MKVILLKDVKGQGKSGELVDVSDGYGRNYLLPRKLATEATKDNLNSMKQQEKAREKQKAKEKAEAEKTALVLEGVVVMVKAKAGTSGRLFGAVTTKEIAEALSQQHGISIEKNKIILAEHIKSFGSYEIKCKLGSEVSGIINVMVTE